MFDFFDGMQQAVARLKSIVPELGKLGLPPTPINYALWYAHLSGRRPELSMVIDKVTKGLAPFDDTLAQTLFQNHICPSGSDASNKAAAKVHLLTTTLHDHMQQSIDSSTRLDKKIVESCQSLRVSIDVNAIAATVSHVVELLDAFNKTNRECRRTMQEADEEISRLRIDLERAQQSANIDDLTRLFNRATFYRELQRNIEHGGATNAFCVVLCDIDFFKSINDRFGHLVGDRVLQRIGALLLEKSRDGTLVARYGGEEFALILPQADIDEATLFAERLRSAIQQTRITIRNSDAAPESLTASFGIARFRAGDTTETLFERADKALYAAKAAGRNNSVNEDSL